MPISDKRSIQSASNTDDLLTPKDHKPSVIDFYIVRRGTYHYTQQSTTIKWRSLRLSQNYYRLIQVLVLILQGLFEGSHAPGIHQFESCPRYQETDKGSKYLKLPLFICQTLA